MEMTKDIIPTRTIGIVSGAVWANEAWGNYWSWDPKESDILDLYGFVIQCAEDLVTGDLGLDHLVGLCWILAHKALCKECERKRNFQVDTQLVSNYVIFFSKNRIELSTCADPSPLFCKAATWLGHQGEREDRSIRLLGASLLDLHTRCMNGLMRLGPRSDCESRI